MSDALTDRESIRELLAVYCFHLDAGRFEEMAQLFTEDGVWETAFGSGHGHAGIVEQARSIAGTGPRPRRVHQTTNIVISLQGDRAEVQSNWTLVQNTPEGPAIGSGGSYFDVVVRRGERWLFQHRRIDRFLAPGKM